jgi:hypothetical protein
VLAACLLALAVPAAALATAHSVSFERAAALWFRTTRDNADYQARECIRAGLVRCGDYITRGDGEQFAADCRSIGKDAGDVARDLRYWARRARAQGPEWRVYTRTERGGYPHLCRFGIVRLG